MIVKLEGALVDDVRLARHLADVLPHHAARLRDRGATQLAAVVEDFTRDCAKFAGAQLRRASTDASDDGPHVTPAAAAAVLGFSVPHVRRLAASGEFGPPEKLGRHWQLDRKAVAAYARNRKQH